MGSPVDCELSSRGHSQRFLKVEEGWEMNSFKECTECVEVRAMGDDLGL